MNLNKNSNWTQNLIWTGKKFPKYFGIAGTPADRSVEIVDPPAEHLEKMKILRRDPQSRGSKLGDRWRQIRQCARFERGIKLQVRYTNKNKSILKFILINLIIFSLKTDL